MFSVSRQQWCILLNWSEVIRFHRFTVGLVMLFRGVDANDHCSWCRYLSCIPTSKWSCKQDPVYCVVSCHFLFFNIPVTTHLWLYDHEIWNLFEPFFLLQSSQSSSHLSLMCQGTGKAQVYPITNASEAKIRDLCTQLCRWCVPSKLLLVYSLYMRNPWSSCITMRMVCLMYTICLLFLVI